MRETTFHFQRRIQTGLSSLSTFTHLIFNKICFHNSEKQKRFSFFFLNRTHVFWNVYTCKSQWAQRYQNNKKTVNSATMLCLLSNIITWRFHAVLSFAKIWMARKIREGRRPENRQFVQNSHNLILLVAHNLWKKSLMSIWR